MRTIIQPLLRQLIPALVALAVFTVGLGVVYPVVVTGIGQVAFSDQADGSLVDRDGAIVGSELIGQPFVSPQYLHPRPSAAGTGFDGSASSGSNLGPSSPELLEAVAERVAAYRELNGLSDDVAVPVDAVTASASGLDPHISVANARLQARRIAEARGVEVGDVLDVIGAGIEEPVIGVLGEAGVDVLAVNLSLDDRFGRPD